MLLNRTYLSAPIDYLRFGLMLLALFATVLSVTFSVAIGWQRGADLQGELLWSGVGVMAALGAHFLPALSRQATRFGRVLGITLWLMCMAFVMYGLTNYFLANQNQSGERRISALKETQSLVIPMPKRTLSSILTEQAKLTSTLSSTSLTTCSDNCQKIQARASVLKVQILALDAEADEVRRWQSAHDRQLTQEQALHGDPGMLRLSSVLGVTMGTLELVTGIMFSVILEGLGSYCWLLLFLRSDSVVSPTITPPVIAPVTDTPSMVAMNTPVITPLSKEEKMAVKVKLEIDAGRLPFTVKAIRDFLGCGQARAGRVRRMIGINAIAA